MMNFSKAFDKTLNHFGISGKWLSEQSGVSQQMISGFRRGQQRIYSDSMERLIQALPLEAQQYFFESLLGMSLAAHTPDLEQVVEEASSVQLGQLLKAIGSKMSSASNGKAAKPDNLPQEALL
jgi:hypothetical protein